MNKYFLYNVVLIGVLFFCVSIESVSADAWWGEGYRPPNWVLAHGGTIIKYRVTGTSHADRYKAMMFRNGQYVEVEFGKHATFDDAKNGAYLINFYKCKGSCTHQKYDRKTKLRSRDKLVASITIIARPGESNELIFDASKKVVQIVGRRGIRKKVDVFVAQKKKAQESEGQICQSAHSKKQKNRLEQFLLLTNSTDREKFRSINKKVGILPKFMII